MWQIALGQKHCGMACRDQAAANFVEVRAGLFIRFPRPRISEPQRRQDVKLGRFRTTIMHCDANQNVFGIRFGIFNEHIKITVIVKDANRTLVFRKKNRDEVGYRHWENCYPHPLGGQQSARTRLARSPCDYTVKRVCFTDPSIWVAILTISKRLRPKENQRT